MHHPEGGSKSPHVLGTRGREEGLASLCSALGEVIVDPIKVSEKKKKKPGSPTCAHSNEMSDYLGVPLPRTDFWVVACHSGAVWALGVAATLRFGGGIRSGLRGPGVQYGQLHPAEEGSGSHHPCRHGGTRVGPGELMLNLRSGDRISHESKQG